MDRVICPKCNKSPGAALPDDDVTDWYYRNDLFRPDDYIDIECPSCDAPLMVHTYPVIHYETEIREEDSHDH